MRFTNSALLRCAPFLLANLVKATAPAEPVSVKETAQIEIENYIKQASTLKESIKSKLLENNKEINVEAFKNDAYKLITDFALFFDKLFAKHFDLTSSMSAEDKATAVKTKLSNPNGLKEFENQIMNVSKEADKSLATLTQTVLSALKKTEVSPLKTFLLDIKNFPESTKAFNELSAEKSTKAGMTELEQSVFINEFIKLNNGSLKNLKTSKKGNGPFYFYLGATIVLGLTSCVLGTMLLRHSKAEAENEEEESSETK